MENIIINMMNDYGYIGVFLLIAIENIFPPIPSEVILTFGGFMTTYATNMHILGVIIASILGSVIGAIILYTVGRILNKDRLEKIVEGKIGKVLRFKKEDIEKANSWFEKRGKFTVFVCRFVPIVRSLISIPAGMSKMKVFPFLILTTIGSAIWNIVLISLGAIAGESWEIICSYIDNYSKVILILLIIIFIVGAFVFYRKRLSKKEV